MLVIREEQIQHFIAADEAALVTLLIEIVRETSPERVEYYDDEKLSGMVKRAAARARERDFRRFQDIAVFVALMFEIAPNFDEQEQIKTVLTDGNFPIEDRLQQLFARVTDEAWTEAQNMYSAKFWFPDHE